MEEKNLLRKEIQKVRDNLNVKLRESASKKIAKYFFKTDEYIKAKNIFIFYPFRSEVNTVIIIKKAIADKKKIILPKVSGKTLKLFFVDDIYKQLEQGAYGIMEPNERLCKQADVKQIDLAVIPGVCFDEKFNRLGYGGGFYDGIIPTLPKKAKKIALCFSAQILKEVPVEEHDSKVDVIITEQKIYKNEGI